MLTPESAILLIARLTAIGTLIASVECLVHRRHLRDDGLMSWPVSRLRQPWLIRKPVGWILDSTLGYPNVLATLAIRAVLATVMIVAPAKVVLSPFLLIPAVITTGLFIIRSTYGQDGSDQMGWILLVALALMSLQPSPLVRTTFLWFVALQSCLSYAQAGIAKIAPARWRDGTYLQGIMTMTSYGHASLARLLERRAWLAKYVSLGLIAWECLFVLVLVAPRPVAVSILGVGVLFHMTSAYVMGLNAFFWQFTAPYPAILCVIQMRD